MKRTSRKDKLKAAKLLRQPGRPIHIIAKMQYPGKIFHPKPLYVTTLPPPLPLDHRLNQMEPLGEEFEKVWNDNTDILYEK